MSSSRVADGRRRLLHRLASFVSPARAVVRQTLHGRLRRRTPANVVTPMHFPQVGRRSVRVPVGEIPEAGSGRLTRTAYRWRRRKLVTLHGTLTEESASSITLLAAAGVPLRLIESRDSQSCLPAALDHAVRAPLDHSRRGRELRSVRIRRAAWTALAGCGDEPTVSVVLASMRPADIDAAVDQVRSQVGCRVELLVGLHGDHWRPENEQDLGELPPGWSVRRYGSEVTFGEVLSDLSSAATGEFVSKWDDDDWYGRNHLADLVRAHRYSGADLVGKAAEFVYLRSSDVTVRRFGLGAESDSSTLAGGALLIRTERLDQLGGWPRVNRGVDQALIRRLAELDGRAYRTHGFEYVLRRGPDAHTWQLDDRHFLDAASEVRPGLDLSFAGFEGAPSQSSAS